LKNNRAAIDNLSRERTHRLRIHLLPGLGMFLIARRCGQLKRRFFMPEFA